MEFLRKSILSLLSSFADLVARQRWALILSFFFCMMAGLLVSISSPRIFEADTLILVEPKSIPDKYVKPLTNTDLRQRVDASIIQQVKSRAYIGQVIKDAELFSGPAYKNMLLEEKIALVRRNLKISVTRGREGVNAFRISYRGRDPEKIATAVNILANFFIDESIKVMEAEVLGASLFLQEERRAKAEQLEAVEKALKEYRIKYMGGLPEQLDSNLKMLDGLYMRLGDKQAELRDGKLMMFQARAEKQQYESAKENVMRCEEDISKLLEKINVYEKRIEDTPKRAQEMMSLERYYENIRWSYENLLKKKLDADMAVSMERKAKGSRFRVLDKAVPPIKPISPDIGKLFLRSLAASFLVGFGLLCMLEFVGWLRGSVPKMKPRKTAWSRLRYRGEQILAVLFILMDFMLLMLFLMMSVKGVDSSQLLMEKVFQKVGLL